MDRIEKLNKLQNEAVNAIIKSGTKEGVSCSIIVVTAFGKTFVKFKLLYQMLSLGWIKKGDKVWYWAEVNIRDKNVEKEAAKFHKIYGSNPMIDFDFEFPTYQSMREGDRVVDLYDEFDFALSAQYSKSISNSTAKFRIGFSGTNEENLSIYRDKIDFTQVNEVRQSDRATKEGKITDFINKGQLASILLPVVYEYHLDQAIEDKILAAFQTIVVEHELAKEGELKIWKSYDTTGSEERYYMAREKIRANFRIPAYRRKRAGSEQTRFLRSLPSKVEVVNKLLPMLEGGTILFGVENALLEMITPNVIKSSTTTFVYDGYYFSSKKTKDKTVYRVTNMLTKAYQYINKSTYDKHRKKYLDEVYRPSNEILDDFESGKIDLIASSKKVSRGATINRLRNAIFVSYYSTNTDASQKLGRLLRYDGNMKNVFIIKTLDTLEERWFDKFQEIKDERGDVKRTLNLNIIRTIKSDQL